MKEFLVWGNYGIRVGDFYEGNEVMEIKWNKQDNKILICKEKKND